MRINEYFSAMENVRKEAYSLPGLSDTRATPGAGLSGFWERAKFAAGLILREKELIVFALLQWACIV